MGVCPEEQQAHEDSLRGHWLAGNQGAPLKASHAHHFFGRSSSLDQLERRPAQNSPSTEAQPAIHPVCPDILGLGSAGQRSSRGLAYNAPDSTMTPDAYPPHDTRGTPRPPNRRAEGTRTGKGPRRHSKAFDWVVRLLAAGFVLAVMLMGATTYLVTRDLSRAWFGFSANPFQPNLSGNPDATPGPDGQATPMPVVVTPMPWQGVERVTILLMGLDYRDWVAGEGPPRTDTMMLVTFDPLTDTAGMLSVPRDLWVEIPGFGHNRINTAYPSGEANRLPGGGPALAVQTVEKAIGVPIQYFAVIDFGAFERMIDEVGGVDVLVEQEVKICPIGRACKILSPKAHLLDGAEALAYARVRKGAGDDFGRAQRQQQVALAILDRVVGLNMVPTLVTKAPALYQELSSGIRTNMSLDEMVSLGWQAVQTPKEKIARGVIAPPNMVGFHTLPTGAAVLRQVPDQIRILRDEIFVQTSGIGP
jgi:LCP family protein required for cell wall assembly